MLEYSETHRIDQWVNKPRLTESTMLISTRRAYRDTGRPVNREEVFMTLSSKVKIIFIVILIALKMANVDFSVLPLFNIDGDGNCFGLINVVYIAG